MAQSASSTHTSRSLRAALAIALALVAWGAARFDFLCDDAYISFRYARNLARGLGFVFNPGDAPVEGFTNLVWVLWLSAWEQLGSGSELGARVGSLACLGGLLVQLARHLQRRAPTPGAFLAALVFFASLPPVWVWATGGLETMAFAWAAFALYERTLCGAPRALPAGAVLALVALLGLRADGFVWAGLVLGGLALDGRLRGERELVRRALALAALAALLTALLVGWRAATFGAFVPNTARVKLAFGALSLERGALYLAGSLAAAPSLGLALALALGLRRGRARRGELAAAVCVAGNFGYVVAVGGDFMAMGRFLVPSLAFAALLLADALAGARTAAARPWLGAAVALALGTLGVCASYDRVPVPRAWRAALHFRWNNADYQSEVERWDATRKAALRWSAQGRLLATLSEPGDSLIIGTIGAVGYHSDLVILDPFGLVNREPLGVTGALGRRSAGHERRVPLEVFLARPPTFLESRFVPADAPLERLREEFLPGGPLAEHARVETYPCAAGEGVPPGSVLRVVRYVP